MQLNNNLEELLWRKNVEGYNSTRYYDGWCRYEDNWTLLLGDRSDENSFKIRIELYDKDNGERGISDEKILNTVTAFDVQVDHTRMEVAEGIRNVTHFKFHRYVFSFYKWIIEHKLI